MARATQSRQIDRFVVQGASLTTASLGTVVREQNFPTGDMGLGTLQLRYDGVIGLSGGSGPTKVTNGHIILMRAVTFETDKHSKIVDAVDGLLLYRMLTYEYMTAPDQSGVASTPADANTFYVSLPIPMVLPHGLRPYDTLLDVLKSRPKLTTQYGPYTDVFTYTGGTPGLKSVTQSVEAKILPGPLNPGANADGSPNPSLSELPGYQRSWEQHVEPINSTANRYQIAIPFGDRIWRRLYITQRNGSDRSELSTVVVGTAEVSLYVNTIPIVDRRIFQDIISLNKVEYQIETLPTGVAVLDFDNDMQERINDMLWTLTRDSGNMYLYIDVTSVSNGQLWLGYDSLKPIPQAALR